MNFKSKAKDYDNETRIKRSKIISKQILELTTNNENKSIMEYGCATGLIGLNLHNKFKKLTLMDSEPEMIKILNRKIKENNLKDVFSINIDLTKQDYNEEKFDIIYSSLTIHHILDVKSIIQKFYNMLNENGILIIVELDEDDGTFHMDSKDFTGHNGFTHQYLENTLGTASFKNINSKTFLSSNKNINGLNIPYSIFYTIGHRN